jgi:hypothetical protein
MVVATREKLEVSPELVRVDAEFGHDRAFWDSLRLPYFADIHSNGKFHASAPSFSVPPWRGKGRAPVVPRPDISPLPASQIIDNSPTPWVEASYSLRSKGILFGRKNLSGFWR